LNGLGLGSGLGLGGLIVWCIIEFSPKVCLQAARNWPSRCVCSCWVVTRHQEESAAKPSRWRRSFVFSSTVRSVQLTLFRVIHCLAFV